MCNLLDWCWRNRWRSGLLVLSRSLTAPDSPSLKASSLKEVVAAMEGWSKTLCCFTSYVKTLHLNTQQQLALMTSWPPTWTCVPRWIRGHYWLFCFTPPLSALALGCFGTKECTDVKNRVKLNQISDIPEVSRWPGGQNTQNIYMQHSWFKFNWGPLLYVIASLSVSISSEHSDPKLLLIKCKGLNCYIGYTSSLRDNKVWVWKPSTRNRSQVWRPKLTALFYTSVRKDFTSLISYHDNNHFSL